MKYYCDDYYQMLDISDKEWIELVIIYLLENNFREIGAFNNLENYFDEVTIQKYIDVKNKLLKYKKSNFEHKTHMCDWQFEEYGGTCGGMLDLIIQSRKLLKLFEVYQNQGLFEEIKNKNLKNISCCFHKNLLKVNYDNFDIKNNVVIVNSKQLELIDTELPNAMILKDLSKKNDVFVAINPYTKYIAELGLQFEKLYGLNFNKEKLLIKIKNQDEPIKSVFKYETETKKHILNYSIKEKIDFIELSMELIDCNNLISITSFIHAKFSFDLSICFHYDKALLAYNNLELLDDMTNNLDEHKDEKKLKLYMINGEFNFDDFIDLIYWGNRKFANVLNECFDLNLSNDELNFYG